MRVARIFVHPVKSLRPIEVIKSYIDEFGFQYDRVYTFATRTTTEDRHYDVLMQHREPLLSLVETAIEGEEIVLRYQHHEMRLPKDPNEFFTNAPVVEVSMSGTTSGAIDVSESTTPYPMLADLLGPEKASNVRLLAPQKRRKVDKDVPEDFRPRNMELSFQDFHPGHLVTTASIDALQRHVDASDGFESERLIPQNFRPNLVIETDEPWFEDDWAYIRIGNHDWLVTAPCQRCSVPSILPELGRIRKSHEPVRSMNKFRILDVAQKPSFGEYIVHTDINYFLRVGDTVEVIKWRD